MNRNKTLDAYKGILIILVVIRHVLQYSCSDEGGILTNFIWAVQMPGFMLVAGYFACRTIESPGMLLKRMLLCARHYALPFLAWFVIMDVLILGGYGRDLPLAVSKLFNKVDNGLWFLWVVFLLSVIASAVSYSLSSRRGKVLKAVAVLFVSFGLLLLLAKCFGLNFIGIKFVLYYAVFYGFGWLCRYLEPWWKKWWAKVRDSALFIAITVFLAIVLNYDLYRCGDDILSIALRCVSGFAGNFVLIWACSRYEEALEKAKVGWLGMYTLEIYVTHMYVNGLMKDGNHSAFFSVSGFANFCFSLLLTILFSGIIIAVFKSIPATDWLFYGKRGTLERAKRAGGGTDRGS